MIGLSVIRVYIMGFDIEFILWDLILVVEFL